MDINRPEIDIKKWIRDIPDFPKKGILFRDITPALLEPGVFKSICDILYDRYAKREIDKIAGIESRGFFFASVLSFRLGIGFVPMRKPGKLPWDTVKEEYTLEYGNASLEIHSDSIKKGERVLIIDDLLATGGTAVAASRLVERLGGIIEEMAFVVELTELGGRERIAGKEIFSLIRY